MNSELESRIDQYIATLSGDFRIREALTSITGGMEFPRGTKKRTEEEILAGLTDDYRIFCGPGGKGTLRRSFFDNGEILVAPTARELEQGILIPGHRFAPFCSSEIFPSEITLKTPDGQNFAVRETTIPLEEATVYCSLLGAEGMYDFLVAESQQNAVRLRNGGKADQLVTLTVLDLADFYRRNQAQPGDMLKIIITDWTQGIFTVSAAVDGEARNNRNMSVWTKALDEGLTKVIEDYDFYLQVPEQFSRAFYLAGNKLLANPSLSLDEYMQQTERIELGYMSGDTALVLRSEQQDEHYDGEMPEEVSVSQGKVGSLEDILQESGCLLKMPEIEAFILNQLYRQEPDFETFYQRCFGEERMQFADEAQEAYFHNYLEDLWETLQTKYDRFADEEKGTLRARVLELSQVRREWLRYLNDLEIDPSTLHDNPHFDDLAATAMHLSSLCQMLNSEQSFITGSEVEAVSAPLDRLADIQENAIEQLNATLGGLC